VSRTVLARAATLALALGIWLFPVPEGLTVAAWHLFALFAAAIFAVVVEAAPILTAAVVALAAAVLTRTLAPAQAYSGFANGTILLIVIAFLVARAVVKCGLGQRIGYLVVSLFGRSTLGLSYSIFLVDGLIAPAFPSNTARSGVLYPLALSLADAAGAKLGDPQRKRLGAFLMYSGIASLSLSSALWLTAMAANPLGSEIAKPFGVTIGFGSWLIAASVPTIAGMLLLPFVLYKVMAPEVTKTPRAPAAAKKALAALGPMTVQEKIVTGTFVGMVAFWAAAAVIVLAAGISIGRATASRVDVEKLRAAIAPEIRQDLNREMTQLVRQEVARASPTDLSVQRDVDPRRARLRRSRHRRGAARDAGERGVRAPVPPRTGSDRHAARARPGLRFQPLHPARHALGPRGGDHRHGRGARRSEKAGSGVYRGGGESRRHHHHRRRLGRRGRFHQATDGAAG
jgi:hypothetical protein